ncbi:MAG: hypothetical protein ACKV22_35825 [Bryobacteraceae bacterium]
MACPYFEPRHRLEDETSPIPPPLGDYYGGRCVAGDPFEPGPETVRDLCNYGYVRGRCARFPGGDAADAVRFTIGSDDETVVVIRYAIERDHYPLDHGELSFRHAAQPRDSVLLRQAQAYLESYLRRL